MFCSQPSAFSLWKLLVCRIPVFRPALCHSIRGLPRRPKLFRYAVAAHVTKFNLGAERIIKPIWLYGQSLSFKLAFSTKKQPDILNSMYLTPVYHSVGSSHRVKARIFP